MPAIVSTPANPPPATTNVMRWSRSGAPHSVSASSSCWIIRLRSAIASPSDFIVIARSSRPGQAEEVRDRAGREDQVVVGQLVRVPVPVGDRHRAGREVDLLDVPVEELHVRDELADRVDDVRDVEVARRDLVEHRREEEEVVPVDDRDVDVREAEEPLVELQGRVDAAEAAADDHDLSAGIGGHHPSDAAPAREVSRHRADGIPPAALSPYTRLRTSETGRSARTS